MTTQLAKEDLSQAATRPKMGWSILRMVVLSIIVGIIAAGLAKLFLMGIGLTETYLHDGALFNVDGTPLMDLAKEQGIENATLQPFNVIVMVVFGLIVGCMTYYLMPNRTNRGLSHVIEDVHYNKGATGFKEGLTVGAISAVSIGAGASVGRFGPAVHLGAAAASGLGGLLKLDDQERLTLSCAGMAAAISASFLSPLAAVIFVQEVVLRQWRLYQFIPIAAAAVAASETALLLDVHFIIPSEIIPDFVNPYEFIFFGIIGLLCGGLAIAFNRALPAAAALVGKHVKIDNRLKPALGGLVLAGICFYFPSVLGLGGYETQLAVAGGIALKLCLILLALKFVATIASFAFGFNGGVFGPSLFMGAMLGLAVGLMVEGAGVEIASLSLYALAGMGAMVAGVVGAVMSAIIMMIEMTGRLTTSLPLLFSVTCVYVVIYLTGQSSLLVNQLKGRGKNPWDEIRAADKKYTGVKES